MRHGGRLKLGSFCRSGARGSCGRRLEERPQAGHRQSAGPGTVRRYDPHVGDQRNWRAAERVLPEGVPDWFRDLLYAWALEMVVEIGFYDVQGVQLDLQRALFPEPLTAERWEDGWPAQRLAESIVVVDGSGLDIVDSLIGRLPWARYWTDEHEGEVEVPELEQRVETLQVILDAASHAWTVGVFPNSAGKWQHRLVRRVPSELIESVAASVGSAGEHLRAAWLNAFGRSGDTTKACHESVKAVEAVLGSIILPKSTSPTLGTLIPAMRDGRSKWQIAIQERGWVKEPADRLGSFIEMSASLWPDPNRHGTAAPVETVSDTEAQAFAMTAAWIVGMAQVGAFSRSAD